MKTKHNQFGEVVQNSRALTSEQKELLLTDWKQLPEGYREKIAAILTEFDERSKTRERELREKLEEEYVQLEEKLDEGEEKQIILTKARKQIDAFFPA